MTEHTRIPLPPEPGSTPKRDSLIERAVDAFDLSKLAPPPMPDKLAPPVVKPAQRHRKPASEQVVQRIIEAPSEAVKEHRPVAPAAEPARAAPPVEPVRFGGPVHAVDRDLLREQGMLVPEGNVTGLLEEFRIVKRQLLLQAADLRRQGGGSRAQRILVCSPHPGEGKTYCSINLALSIAAEKESEVVLVDADFAKPSILSSLGLPAGPGLMDALTSPKADVAQFVQATDIPGLFVLPAGNATNTDSEYLNASHTAEVLERLTQGAPHRMVIFDSPPALAASPAAELAKYVGQAVMIVRADLTGQGALDDAVSLLSGCPNIQLLLNAVNFSPSGRRFGTYYGYGG